MMDGFVSSSMRVRRSLPRLDSSSAAPMCVAAYVSVDRRPHSQEASSAFAAVNPVPAAL